MKLAGQQYYIQLSDKWQLRWFILTETHLSYYRYTCTPHTRTHTHAQHRTRHKC